MDRFIDRTRFHIERNPPPATASGEEEHDHLHFDREARVWRRHSEPIGHEAALGEPDGGTDKARVA